MELVELESHKNNEEWRARRTEREVLELKTKKKELEKSKNK